MLRYSLELAIRGLLRFPKTTALAVLTIAIGLAASMTTLALLHMLSADPLPGRSQHLYLAWADTIQAKPWNYVPADRPVNPGYKRLREPDVQALMDAHKATMQAAVAVLDAGIEGDGGRHSDDEAMVGTTADFIPMFGVALIDGRNWSAQEDASRAPVAVIDSTLAQTLFGTSHAVGKVVEIKHHAFRVIGVSQPFTPQPHFYGLDAWSFSGDSRESVFAPYTALLDAGIVPNRNDGCDAVTAEDRKYTNSDPAHCAWLGYWVQLDNAGAVSAYRSYLDHYAQQQTTLAGFGKKPVADLWSVSEWLTFQSVIPDNVRLNVWLSVSFLLLCMVNVAGLLAAKFMRRGGEVGIRRALGATRSTVMLQHLIEACLICVLGGVLAWPLTLLGLALLRMQDEGFTDLAHLDVAMFAGLFGMALLVGALVGLLPSWRVSMVQPGLQIKTV
jgi:putative ABC transport system permease protein